SQVLTQVLSYRIDRARRARDRAKANFSFDVIFPKYMQAFSSVDRTPLPTPLQVFRLARSGYPVLPTTGDLLSAFGRRAPAIIRRAAGRAADLSACRVGWVTYDSFPGRKRRFVDLDSFTGMRVGNIARWINAHERDMFNELYMPGRRYDVVIFQKMMDARSQAEAEKVKARGGKVVFDANVNYYQTWGDYFVPGTRPPEQQQRAAVRMTTMC